MKNILYLASIALLLTACNGPAKTGNSQADSGSHGSSGAAPASQTGSSTGSSATSNGTSDTSKKLDAPMVDTSKQRKHD
jgi:hypothetical protein